MHDMPTTGSYRDVELHAFQTQERIEKVVCPQIDLVHETEDHLALLRFLRNYTMAPEARLAAGRKLLAPAEAAEAGRRRAPVDAALVKALMTGLGTLRCADPRRYGTIYHVSPPDAPQPDARPPEHRAALEAAQRKARGLR